MHISVSLIVSMCLVLLGVTARALTDSPKAKQKPPRPGEILTWQGEKGDSYAFDGVFYSFANRSGQGVKLWIPPTERPIRGLLLHGNPGGGFGGDTRGKTRQRDVLEFAARHNFAVAGVTGFQGRRIHAELATHIIEALRQWGGLGHHPELAHVPFISTGGSNAGVFSFQMMCFAPQRTIAITPNVGGIYGPPVTEAVLSVPAWMHIGTLDELLSSGVENTEALFAKHGAQSPLWAWDAEMKGHENGSADHVDVAYWDVLIGLRLSDVTAPDRPVPLRRLDPKTGWWVDQRSWDHRITAIHAAKDFRKPKGSAGRYGWMPTEGLARLYQAVATRSRPLQLSVKDMAARDASGTSGVYLSSGQGILASPGDEITLQVEHTKFLRGVQNVEIHDQKGLVGVVDLSESDTFTLKVDGARCVYALYAYARDSRGAERISAPVQVLVRDPKISARIDDQLRSVSLPAVFRARANAHAKAGGLQRVKGGAAPPTGEQALPAILLTADQSRLLQKPGEHRATWKAIANAIEPVRLDERHARSKGGSAVIQVRAAYDRETLYLCFEVADSSFDLQEGKPLIGSMDFHLASTSRAILAAAPSGPEVYANARCNALLRTAMQIQIPVAGSLDADVEFTANYWDPWDPVRFEASSADAYAGTGIRIERYDLGAGRRAVELCLPWPMVGNPGLPSAPPAGSRFALVLGYNGQVGGRQGKLRWPFGRDPWSSKPSKGDKDPVYGELVLLAGPGEK